MPKINLPTWATVALSLLAGVLTVLNQAVLQFASPWGAYVTIALVFIAALGIGPLTGPAFRAALHLSQTLATLIGAALAAIALAVTTIHVASGVQAVILGLLTVAAGLGFAPTPQIVVPAHVIPVRKARSHHAPPAGPKNPA